MASTCNRVRHAFLGIFLTALAMPADASVTSPTRSLRWLGGRQVWVPLCSRRGVNGSAAWFDNTNTAIMDQQACISPSWGTVTALKLVFAAFDMPQQGEVDRPITASGTAALFAPSLNSLTAFGGAAVGAGSLVLNAFPGTALGSNGISLGQSITTTGGGIAAASYVANVTNAFNAGSGNVSGNTTVTLSPATTGATSNGQPFTFSGLFTPVKFFGKRTFTIEPGHDVITSDPASVELPPSTWFLVRTAASMSGVGMQLSDLPASSRLTVSGTGGSFQEFDNRGTTLNDQTMTPAALSNTGGGYWGPVTLLAQITASPGQSTPGAVLILGDSIAAGTGDTPDALGLEGYVQRSLENNVPFVAAARGSTTSFGLVSHGDGQYALSIDSGITDVLLEAGRNDIQQYGLMATLVAASTKSIAQRYSAAGKRVWCFTVPPTTYSNDGWLTAANQGFPAAIANTGAATTPAGAVQITMASVANVIVGQGVSLNLSAAGAIAPGSTVTAVNTGTLVVTVSPPTTAAIAAGTKLYFSSSTQANSAVEVQRAAYNSTLRSNWTGMSCSGLIDIDGTVSDPANPGKWRTDLGQASMDGVHPSAVLHQAAVNAGLITQSMFSVP